MFFFFVSLQSFFGRSYNNISSISECKNNGECIINKKNRTACKACRLRKCLMVGMSKSGSRYGRRSNWFKIHCLLQEQQAAAQQHANNQKNSIASNMIGASQSFQPRHPTKEELMMFGIEDYYKQSSASPSISSPDSHNSDSSIEIGSDKRNLLLRNTKIPEVPSLSKDHLPFLQLPFPGLPLMPPPGFLPSSNLLFPGYHHPALYPHSLLKHTQSEPSPFTTSANNNSRFIQNNNNNITKKVEDCKRFYLDHILQSQKSPYENDATEHEKDGEQTKLSNNSKEEITTITPPRSPCITPQNNQDNPIDLSMKTTTTNSSTDDRVSLRGSIISEETSNGARSNNVSEASEESESDDDSSVYKNETKRMKIQGTTTTPLDLTTKA